jgi:hypothetical protein
VGSLLQGGSIGQILNGGLGSLLNHFRETATRRLRTRGYRPAPTSQLMTSSWPRLWVPTSCRTWLLVRGLLPRKSPCACHGNSQKRLTI